MAENWREVAEGFAAFLLSLPKGKRKRTGDRVHGNCPRPSHEDKHPSFGYNIAIDAWACSCGKGKGSELREELGYVVQGPSAPPEKPVVATTYLYRDEAGQALFEVLRYVPKSFRQRHPCEKGEGGWTWGLGGDPARCPHEAVRRVPYRLPDILGQEPDLPILVVDGEKDVETAWKLGIAATCAPHGMKNWRDDYSLLLKDHPNIVIVADKDPDGKGRDDAKAVGESFEKIGVHGQVVEMPGPMPPVKDLSDWVATGGTLEDLKKLVASPWIKKFKAEAVPISSLADLIDADVPYVINPIAIRGCITELQGIPKGGKSTFMLYLSVAAATCEWTYPEFLSANEAVKTLYVAYEDVQQLLVQRAARYAQGLGHPERFLPVDLDVFAHPPEIWLDDSSYADYLVRMIRASDYRMVVFDTLSYVHRMDENDASEMKIPMFNLKRVALESGAAIVYVHHTAKGSKERPLQERGRGSSAIAGAADVIVDWGDRGETDTTPVHIRSKWGDDVRFRVEYVRNLDRSIAWKLLPTEDEENNAQNQAGKIIAALRDHLPGHPDGLTAKQLRELSDVPERSFYRRLKDLIGAGKVLAKPTGRMVFYTFPTTATVS